MSRVSISLPDELLARLEPIKERINISRVCREALEKRVAIFEQTAVRQDDELDLEGLVTRLREERVLIEGKWDNLGRRNAAIWLGTTSYMELKNVIDQQRTSDMDRYRLPRGAFRVMKQDMKQEQGSLEGDYAIAYKTAWLDYVRAVWTKIEQQVEETKDTEPVAPTE